MADWPTIEAGTDWTSLAFLTPLHTALSERMRATGGSPFNAPSVGTDVQDHDWIADWQSAIVGLGESQGQIGVFLINPGGYDGTAVTWDDIRDAAGLHADGFERRVPDGAGGYTVDHGYCEAGDYIGPWIWQEIMECLKVIPALTRWVGTDPWGTLEWREYVAEYHDDPAAAAAELAAEWGNQPTEQGTSQQQGSDLGFKTIAGPAVWLRVWHEDDDTRHSFEAKRFTAPARLDPYKVYDVPRDVEIWGQYDRLVSKAGATSWYADGSDDDFKQGASITDLDTPAILYSGRTEDGETLSPPPADLGGDLANHPPNYHAPQTNPYGSIKYGFIGWSISNVRLLYDHDYTHAPVNPL